VKQEEHSVCFPWPLSSPPLHTVLH
jgi:hypothetical protein